jgi:hypothetical protein
MLMVNLITLKLKGMQQDTLLLICLLKIYKTGLHLKRNKSAAWGSCRKNLTTQQSLDGRSKKGFIAGRNDKEDLEAMIWLLKILKHPIL